jgi:hypothetical protein
MIDERKNRKAMDVVKSFKYSVELDEEVSELLERKDWNFSAFVRVAIRESLNKIKMEDEKNEK